MSIDPEIQRILLAVEETGTPDVEHMPIAQARLAGPIRATIDALGLVEAPPPPVGEVTQIDVPTPGGPVAVRMYRPLEPDAAPPLLVWMHGGGFVLGSLDIADPIARTVCAGTGAIVASVDYPLAPEQPFPAAPHACHAVAAWCVEHHAEIGFDPARLAVGGDSAGGNLAAATSLLAAQRGGPDICAQLLVYPMIDRIVQHPSMRENAEGYLLTASRIEWFWRQYLPDAERESPLASPLHAADLAGQPPAVVVTAALDPLRDEGEAYAERLRGAGVPVTATRYDGLIHGFFVMGGFSAGARAAVDETIAAFGALLRQERQSPNTNAGSFSSASGSA